MKNETVSFPDWRPLVVRSIAAIVITYPLIYVIYGIGSLFSTGATRMSVRGILYSFLSVQEWGYDTFTSVYCVVAHVIFAAFCLWWYRTRHPLFYALIPFAALSCTAFSMYATHLLSAALGMEAYPVIRLEIAAHLVLLALCLWWWRTKTTALYIWLPLALLACSPFGIGFMLMVSH